MAQASEFRTGNLTPDQAERFAALFIPTWELPPEINAGPDPGFKPAAAMDANLVASLGAAPVAIPTAPTPAAIAPNRPKATIMGMAATPDHAPPASVPPPAPEAPKPVKATMMGIAPMEQPVQAPITAPPSAPPPAPEVVAVAPPAPAAPKPQLPSIMIEEPPPQPKISVAKQAPLLAVEASDAYPALQKKRSPLLFVGIGAALAAVIGVAVVATRGSEPEAKPQPSAMPVIEKKLELPEPPAVTAAAPAATPAPAEAKTAESPVEAKTAEKPVEKPVEKAAPTAVAPPPPPPPKAAAPKAAAAPVAPKAAPAGGGKKSTAVKIKDEF